MKLTSPKTLKILEYIINNKQFTQQEISIKLNISIGQVNKVITFLMEKGFIQKNKRNYSLIDLLGLLKAISLFADRNLKTENKLINLAVNNKFNEIYSILNPKEKTNKIKVALVGFGVTGKFHYKTILKFSELELKAVCDLKKVNLPLNINYYKSYKEMINNEILDAIIIASPSSTHKEIVDYAINHNLYILVETPATLSDNDFRSIMTYKKLFVGTTESFNPAIIKLTEILKNEEVLYIDIYRQGPTPVETREKDALFHLGIHDLYFISKLFDIEDYYMISTKPDIYRILLRSNNTIITLHIDWKTSKKRRIYEVGCRDKTIKTDLISQEITIFHGTKRNKTYSYEEQIKGVNAGKIETLTLNKKEPFVNEYEAFIHFIKNKTKLNYDDYLKTLNLIKLLESK